MSCSECERESDNKHFQCPPKMADGRAFTDYKTRCGVQSTLMHDKAMNSYELRQYLINNAEALMQQNRDYAEKVNACGPCMQPWHQGTMLPEQSMVRCNESTCSVSTNDPYGLGQGRDYGITNDNQFLAKMQARDDKMRTHTANGCTGYDDDLKYFPVTPVAEERYAIPGGGAPF